MATEISQDSHHVKRSDHFVYAPSQWETALQCNTVSHWLGAFTKWSLQRLKLDWYYCINSLGGLDTMHTFSEASPLVLTQGSHNWLPATDTSHIHSIQPYRSQGTAYSLQCTVDTIMSVFSNYWQQTLQSTSIIYWSDVKVLDRCLLYVDRMVFAICSGIVHLWHHYDVSNMYKQSGGSR